MFVPLIKNNNNNNNNAIKTIILTTILIIIFTSTEVTNLFFLPTATVKDGRFPVYSVKFY